MARVKKPRKERRARRTPPGAAPAADVARVLGMTVEQFDRVLPSLIAQGFPGADPVTGTYDMAAIKRWCGARRWFELDLIVDHWREFGREPPDNPKVLVAIDAAESVEYFQIEITHHSSVPVLHPELDKGGRPTKWEDFDKRCAWRAVEVEHQLAKRVDPKIKLEPALKKLFGRRGRVLYINSNGPLIESASIAVRYHREGKDLLAKSPDRELWKNMVKDEVAQRAAAAQKPAGK